MLEFTVVDLYSQRQAVASYVLGRSVEDVLDWLGHYGSIREYQPTSPDRPHYLFRSFAGLTCWFCFDDNLNLTVPTSGWFYS